MVSYSIFLGILLLRLPQQHSWGFSDSVLCCCVFHLVVLARPRPIFLVLQFVLHWVTHRREVQPLAIWQNLAAELLLAPLGHLPEKCDREVGLVPIHEQDCFIHIACQLSQAARLEKLLHRRLRLVFEHEEGHRALKLALALDLFGRVAFAAGSDLGLREPDRFFQLVLLDELHELLLFQVEQ